MWVNMSTLCPPCSVVCGLAIVYRFACETLFGTLFLRASHVDGNGGGGRGSRSFKGCCTGDGRSSLVAWRISGKVHDIGREKLEQISSSKEVNLPRKECMMDEISVTAGQSCGGKRNGVTRKCSDVFHRKHFQDGLSWLFFSTWLFLCDFCVPR